MRVRTYRGSDFDRLLALTIEVFGPLYQEPFPSIVGHTIATHQHGNWREDYREELTGLHDPGQDKHVVVAETDDRIVGDQFHAPTRAFYQDLGMTPFPVVVYFKEL